MHQNLLKTNILLNKLNSDQNKEITFLKNHITVLELELGLQLSLPHETCECEPFVTLLLEEEETEPLLQDIVIKSDEIVEEVVSKLITIENNVKQRYPCVKCGYRFNCLKCKKNKMKT
jgi:hypothetical protein